MQEPARVKPTRSETAVSSGGHLLTRPLVVFFLLSFLATVIYSNTFSSSFHFDDKPNIVENPGIKALKNFLDFSNSRYVGFLSFALNYHFGGLNVFGYHLANLLIHITNGFLVYHVVLLLFQCLPLSPPSSLRRENAGEGSQRATAPGIALATALLFVSHPIQTQAVTYIVQRFASLAALFYLLTVVCYLKWRLAPADRKRRYRWYIGALISTILAMKTKENSFTLPLMILLIEAVFFRPFTRKRWVALIPFLLTLLIIPFSRVDAVSEAEGGFAQETTAISRSAYLLTQFRVIMTYLRLLILPINQNLDYDYPIYHSLLDPPVLLSFLFLLFLLVFSFYLLFNSKFRAGHLQLIALGILWFLMALSIESSVIPIRDVIFEHRVYLASTGLFLAITISTSHLISHPRFRMISLSLILLILSSAAYQRNHVWKDDFSLWKDAVNKSPGKARAHHNLGLEYEVQRRLDEAAQEYRLALKLQPDFVLAYNNLGNILVKQGRIEEAVQEYRRALKLQSDSDMIHNNLASALLDQGHLAEAIEEFQAAIKLRPDSVKAHYNLGNILVKQGRIEEAVQEYRRALKLQPDSAVIHNNLASALLDQGHLAEAIEEFQAAIKLRPDFVDTHYNLAMAYANRQRLQEAVQEYQTVIHLKPDHPSAHNNIGNIYAHQGKIKDALAEYQAVLRLDPNYAEAHYNLGVVYTRLGRFEEARRHYQEALKIKPDLEAARKAAEFLPK
ncbi:MAG: tetratricopeptide repeat protein [Nitrospirae bacterium]|nr:tetratricopeptide repeat protein [Nitrospirota bacterium]